VDDGGRALPRQVDKAFYEKLIAKQKAPLQALVAVMRKLLHSIHGMLRTGTDFDGTKFYAIPESA